VEVVRQGKALMADEGNEELLTKLQVFKFVASITIN
jgi:hypothetical protein